MFTNKKTESIDQSIFSTQECTSKSDEEGSKLKPRNSIDFLVVTRIPKKIYKFRWIIRQFSILSKNEAIYSTCIHVSDTSCYRLKLVKYEHGYGLFHVDGKREKSSKTNTATSQYGELAFSSSNETTYMFGPSDEPISFSVITPPQLSAISEQREPKKVQKTNEFKVVLEYQITATDNRGKELMKWLVSFSNASESQSFQIGEYINNTLERYPDDSLILDCNLKVFSSPTSEEIPISFKPTLECNAWKKLSKDLKALYQGSLDTDVTLVVGNDNIRAHKSILIARSTIFNKIFHHDMKESGKNSVTITDVPFSTMQKLVEFLYSGDILEGDNEGMNLEELYDLYYAADKYQVMDLRDMVGNSLLERIQVDNASELLLFADRHNDEDLKSRIMNFIRINFEEVVSTDTWQSYKLQHPLLAMKVYDFYVKKIKSAEKKV